MPHIPGSRQGTRLWRRCPFCGDSPTHPNKAHFFIDLQTLGYHCYRCNESGLLPLSTIIELFEKKESLSALQEAEKIAEGKDEQLLRYQREIHKGPGTSRESGLDRYHYTSQGGLFDVFEARDVEGSIVGLHFRSGKGSEKQAFHIGQKGLGYADTLYDIDPPLVLVEGPYDVQHKNEVCTFGLFSRAQLAKLRGIPVVLCPDGDVWVSKTMLRQMLKNVKISKSWVTGFLYLQKDDDPEDVPLEERHFISLIQARRKLDDLERSTVHTDSTGGSKRDW